MLYTRTGDSGMSGLFGTKKRYRKTSSVYEALGALDELNSLLGVCRSRAARECSALELPAVLYRIQEKLFVVQAELAGSPKSIEGSELTLMEETIHSIEKAIKKPGGFVVPGSTELSALLDYARATSRRTERAAIAAHDLHPLSPTTRAYLNRLSSLLYAAARYAAMRAGVEESSPTY